MSDFNFEEIELTPTISDAQMAEIILNGCINALRETDIPGYVVYEHAAVKVIDDDAFIELEGGHYGEFYSSILLYGSKIIHTMIDACKGIIISDSKGRPYNNFAYKFDNIMTHLLGKSKTVEEFNFRGETFMMALKKLYSYRGQDNKDTPYPVVITAVITNDFTITHTGNITPVQILKFYCRKDLFDFRIPDSSAVYFKRAFCKVLDLDESELPPTTHRDYICKIAETILQTFKDKQTFIKNNQ